MPKITDIEQTSSEYIRQGFNLLEVPVEHKHDFELDMQGSLMNIAGISISTSTRFIQFENLAKCYHEGHKNPFNVNTIVMGMSDTLQLKDFFDHTIIPPEIYSRPIFIHCDLSVTGDKTGIGAVAVMGYKNENRYSISRGETETTKELYYHHVFSCRIQAPSTDEISLQKTRDFIYYLKYQLGWNIWGVSTDGFQSVDFRQQLKTAGFENVDLVSLDRTPDGYITYKYAINEQRIAHLNIEELEFEIINLARDNMTGKIDHDADKCFTGDTKIKLVDGRDLTILELLVEQEYKTNWVYTFNEEKKIIEPKPIKKIFQTMITKDLVRVTLDNGESVTCTPNHKFMLRDGTYLKASELYYGCSLMPMYTKLSSNGLSGRTLKNHKVILVEYINNPCRVYDLEIQDNHNFALSTGIIVHNSKDEADGIAGAVYNASLHEQDLNLGAGDMYEVIFDANENNTDDEKTDLLQKISASQPQMSQNANPFMPSNKVGTNTMLPSELQKLIAQKEGFNDDDNGFFFL